MTTEEFLKNHYFKEDSEAFALIHNGNITALGFLFSRYINPTRRSYTKKREGKFKVWDYPEIKPIIQGLTEAAKQYFENGFEETILWIDERGIFLAPELEPPKPKRKRKVVKKVEYLPK